ncbi:MAG: metallophosphoesterase family protein [Desulfuromonadaceae bacterium]|nr:metallophosphoesterase family protein [Desulfuromonadaceae bacterium]
MNSNRKRVIAVGDVHGCNKTLQALLFDRIKLKKTDTVILIGDLVDRGPDSKGVLDTIMNLQSEGYTGVRCLLGNHEDMLLQAIRTGDEYDLQFWQENGGDEALESFGVKLPQQMPEEYISFLKGLKLYYQTTTHVFVHAGLNFSLDKPLSKKGRDSMLWERRVKVEPDKIGERKLVTGHTIMALNLIAESLESNLIQLDNGCFMGKRFKGKGSLVALDVNNGELFVQENIE